MKAEPPFNARLMLNFCDQATHSNLIHRLLQARQEAK